MSLPLLSICCTTYNQEKYVTQAIEGFLIQETTFPIEIIIHDDASTDNTVNIIKSFAEKDDRIVTILQEENQYSQNNKPWNNYVFPKAKGKYIALCEGDDYWTDPLKLQKQVDFLEANPDYGLCFHNVNVLNMFDDTFTPDNYSNNSLEDSTINDLVKKNYINTLSVVLRNDFKLQPYFNEFKSGDWPLYVIQIKDRRIKRLNEIMGVYRVHDGGVWSSINKLEKITFLIDTIELMISEIPLSDTSKKPLGKRLSKLKFKRIKQRVKNALKLYK